MDIDIVLSALWGSLLVICLHAAETEHVAENLKGSSEDLQCSVSDQTFSLSHSAL